MVVKGNKEVDKILNSDRQNWSVSGHHVILLSPKGSAQHTTWLEVLRWCDSLSGLSNSMCCFLAFSESDSDWSSLERKQRAAEAYSKANRKSTPHKRVRKKRTAIPVPTPRVPNTQPYAPDGAGMLSYRLKDEKSRGAGDSLDRGTNFVHCILLFFFHLLFND